MMNDFKHTIVTIIGITAPGGMAITSFIDRINPILQFIGLIISICIGITVLILNRKRTKKIEQDMRINDIILKHPEIKKK